MEFIFHSDRLYSAINFTAIQHTSVDIGWSYPSHRHTSIEFLFCLDGVLLQKIGDDYFPLKKGDSMIIRPNMYHETKAIKDSEFLGFHFDIEDTLISSIFQNSMQSVISELDKESYEKINDIVFRFVDEFGTWFQEDKNDLATHEDKLQYSIIRLKIHSQLLELLYKITSLCSNEYQQTQHLSINDTEIAENVVRILENNKYQNFTIQSLSDELHMHRTHITKVFTKVYGISPKMYHNQLRLQLAKQKLLETDMSLSEISDEMNFSSTSHFSKFFTKFANITPSQYRNRQYSE